MILETVLVATGVVVGYSAWQLLPSQNARVRSMGYVAIVGLIVGNLRMVVGPALRTTIEMHGRSVEHETMVYYDGEDVAHRAYDHPVVQAFVQPKVHWMKNALPDGFVGIKVLDVGGGNGYFSSPLFREGAEVHVLDISARQLKMNPLPRAQCHLGTAYHPPSANQTFEVVLASNLLHHLDYPTLALQEMVRVARKHVIIVEPSNANPFLRLGTLLARHEDQAGFHSQKVVRSLLDSIGLHTIAQTF